MTSFWKRIIENSTLVKWRKVLIICNYLSRSVGGFIMFVYYMYYKTFPKNSKQNVYSTEQFGAASLPQNVLVYGCKGSVRKSRTVNFNSSCFSWINTCYPWRQLSTNAVRLTRNPRKLYFSCSLDGSSLNQLYFQYYI